MLVLLLAAISIGAMAEWVRVEDGLSYDSASIQKSGDLVILATRIGDSNIGYTFLENEFDCKVPGKLRLNRVKRSNDGEWEIYSEGKWVVRHQSPLWSVACSFDVDRIAKGLPPIGKLAPPTSSTPEYAEKATDRYDDFLDRKNPRNIPETSSAPTYGKQSLPPNPADSTSAKVSSLLRTVFAVTPAVFIGYLLFKLLGGSIQGSTPVATGRRWMNWLVYLSPINSTARGFAALFSGFGDPGWHFAQAVIVVPIFALIGFVAGWLFAKIRGPKEEPLAEHTQPRNDENEAPPRYQSKQTVQAAVHADAIREKAPSSPAPHKYGPSEYPDFRPTSAGSDTLQASVYAAIAKELESGETDKGLWTRLFAEANGDEKMTKVAYIKQRAAKLMEAERTRSPAPEHKKSVVPEKPPTNGDDEWQLAKQSADLADQLHLSIAEARAMVTLGIEKKGDRFILKDGRGYNTLVEAISSARRGNG